MMPASGTTRNRGNKAPSIFKVDGTENGSVGGEEERGARLSVVVVSRDCLVRTSPKHSLHSKLGGTTAAVASSDGCCARLR